MPSYGEVCDRYGPWRVCNLVTVTKSSNQPTNTSRRAARAARLGADAAVLAAECGRQ